MKPIFAYGRDNIVNPTSAISATNTRIYLDASDYTVGDHVLIGESASSQYDYEYFGTVSAIAVDDTYIDVTNPAQRAYTTGAYIWTPSNVLLFDRYFSLPVAPPVKTYNDAFIQLGSGALLSSRIGVDYIQIERKVERISATVWSNLVTWYRSTIDGASNYFWLIDYDAKAYRVKMMSNLSSQFVQMTTNIGVNVLFQFDVNLTSIS